MRTFAVGILLSLVFMLSFGNAEALPRKVDVEKDSIVIGQFEGHIVTKKYKYGYEESPEWILKGFELKNVDTGKVKKLKLDRKGHFAVVVPEGSYVLQRNKKDRKNIPYIITKFKVAPGKLINIGTYRIDKDPIKDTFSKRIVRFRIYHKSDAESARIPMEWFAKKYPVHMEKYIEKIVDFYSSETTVPGKASILPPKNIKYVEDDCIRKKIYKSDFVKLSTKYGSKRDWPIGDYKYASFKVIDGKYVFENKDKYKNISASHYFLLSSEKDEDFTLETTFARSDNADKKTAIIWIGSRKHFVGFGLKKDSVIYCDREGDMMKIHAERDSQYVNAVTNKIIITRRGAQLKCFVNDYLVMEVTAELTGCNFFGFELIGDMTVEVDRIYVTLDKKPNK